MKTLWKTIIFDRPSSAMDDDGWSKFLLSNRNSPPLLNNPVRRSFRPKWETLLKTATTNRQAAQPAETLNC